ncbi:zinc finger C2H2-like protein [Podospora fimiseda]|uniref:Zinc finger C2H2-like protein n=1 Tax=Podospora fimiseda TaxID=252190 RepID=A0AAN7BW28_9PEZI|nr:zinc finger C2H2-like protein [Podospora fimiseda]
MSDFLQHRAMHHEGFYSSAIHNGHHHHVLSSNQQTHHPQNGGVIDQFFPCPYDQKVVKDGTSARMALMFIRELIDQHQIPNQFRQNYGCPMTRCTKIFADPLQLIQHLLSCPELSNSPFFDCDKCSHCHAVPTNEKDWEQWAGWKTQQTPQESQIRRKQSLGSKIKGAWGKKDSRKQNLVSEPHFKTEYSDTRPSTAASEASSIFAMSKTTAYQPGIQGQGNTAIFSAFQKPVLPSTVPAIDGGSFWPGFSDQFSNVPSTVSSIALSSTLERSPSKAPSQNTSVTTLYTPTTPGLGPYQPTSTSAQVSNNTLSQPQFVFTTRPHYDGGATPIAGPSPSAMALDDPLPTGRPNLLQPTASSNNTWVSTTTDFIRTPIPAMNGVMSRHVTSGLSTPTSPCGHASPYYQMQHTPSAYPLSRALSHESMQTGVSNMFGSPVADRGHLDPLSPQSIHEHHSSMGIQRSSSSMSTAPEDLVCDECQWKPRGVRENLKGYLRKHKNTHKGLRLACEVPDCAKTFSRLDNLKKHKKEKHGIEDPAGVVSLKQVAEDSTAEHIEDESEQKRPNTVESEVRGVPEDYSMLWPALHF